MSIRPKQQVSPPLGTLSSQILDPWSSPACPSENRTPGSFFWGSLGRHPRELDVEETVSRKEEVLLRRVVSSAAQVGRLSLRMAAENLRDDADSLPGKRQYRNRRSRCSSVFC